MKIAVISFTSSGKIISNKIVDVLDKLYDCGKSTKITEIIEIDKNTFDDKLSKHMADIFNDNDAIIFISSTGIAVRMIAPYIKSKITDPAVVVIDDLGKYTISLISGHIGGANELALKVSNILNNQVIISTASDGRGIDAVDMFAKRNKFYIEDMEMAKHITALMVEGENIELISEVEADLNYASENPKEKSDGIIVVSSIENIEEYLREEYLDKDDYNKSICVLRPKSLNIGIGCRRGKSRDEILSFIRDIFKDNNISLKSINKVGTIDIKHDEIGIIEVSKYLNAEMILFSKDEIESVSQKFNKSDFVKLNVGVTSVCEPSAYLLGEEIIVSKQILNGITIAVSRSGENG